MFKQDDIEEWDAEDHGPPERTAWMRQRLGVLVASASNLYDRVGVLVSPEDEEERRALHELVATGLADVVGADIFRYPSCKRGLL